MSETSFSKLPVEIVAQIFYHVGPLDLANNCANVCRRWMLVVDNQIYSRAKILRWRKMKFEQQITDHYETLIRACIENKPLYEVERILASPEIPVNKCLAANSRMRTAPLLVASLNGLFGIVRSLLKRDDIDANVTTIYGETAINFISSYFEVKDRCGIVHPHPLRSDTCHLLVLRELLNSEKADINIPDKLGKTALIHAADKSNNTAIRALICEDTIKANLFCRDGWAPIHYAAASGNSEGLAVLVESGKVDVNSVTANGYTALHLAVKNYNKESSSDGVNHHTECVRILLEDENIDLALQDRSANTAYKSACRLGHGILARMIKKVAKKKDRIFYFQTYKQ